MTFYGLLLHLFPRAFRAEFGDEIEAVFRERLREAAPSRPALARVWLEGVADVVRQAAAEWLRRVDGRGFRPNDAPRARLIDAGFLELRPTLRSLRTSPAFTGAAVLTLALGIGANTAVFNVVYTVLLRPLPYMDSDRLVTVWPEVNFNVAMVERIKADVPALTGLAGASVWRYTLTGGAEPEELSGARVTAGYFELLGASPLLGRAFSAEEERDGGAVVVLGHDLWMRRFGGDPSIVGRSIPLDGGDARSGTGAASGLHTVVGVLPADFAPAAVGMQDVAFFTPLPASTAPLGEDRTWWISERVGRLASGASPEQATEQLRRAAAAIRLEVPNVIHEADARAASVRPLREAMVAGVSTHLWILLGLAGMVLLMGCTNVANLLLARGEARLQELRVRRALGAGRVRIAASVLTESVILGLAGGALGLAIAAAMTAQLGRYAHDSIPRVAEMRIDGATVAFVLLVSLASAVLFGAAPALRAARMTDTGALREARTVGVGFENRLGSALIAVEVALAVLIVTASGLMLRSLGALLDVDPGFRAAGLIAFRTSPQAEAEPPAGPGSYYGRVEERLRGLPGVTSVGSIQLRPLSSGNWSFPTYVEDLALAADEAPPSLNFRVVTPGYFRAMGIPLREGRELGAQDGPGAEQVAVVNRALAERYWPRTDPVGKELRFFSPKGAPVRVVGVVGDVRQTALDVEARPEIYLPLEQYPWGSVSLWTVVRVQGDPERALGGIRDAVWDVDPDVPVSDLDTMDRMVGRSTGNRRLIAVLLGGFALLALTLGGIGVYGVTSYAVARRLPEFGVRMALGAGRSRVVGTAMGRSVGPVAVGVLLGLAGAGAGAGVLRPLLFGVGPYDPATLVSVAGFLGLTGLLASALPALRAVRADPVAALRGR